MSGPNNVVLAILDTARKEIGVKESPPGSNRQKYGEWYGVNGVPWCAQFTSYIFHKAGFPLPSIQKGAPSGAAYCPYIESYARKNNQWHGTPQPGDLALYHFGKNEAVHIGIVESVTAHNKRTFNAIEGNTSVKSNDNGGCVMRRARNVNQCRGFYRPRILSTGYKPNPNGTGDDSQNSNVHPKDKYYRLIELKIPFMEGDDIEAWQTQMNWFQYGLDTDGVYGIESQKACLDLQRKRNLFVDGVIGPNTWRESFERD